MSLSTRIAKKKWSAERNSRCANKTCQRLYDESATQSPLCESCGLLIQKQLTERMLSRGFGL